MGIKMSYARTDTGANGEHMPTQTNFASYHLVEIFTDCSRKSSFLQHYQNFFRTPQDLFWPPLLPALIKFLTQNSPSLSLIRPHRLITQPILTSPTYLDQPKFII